MLTWFAGASSVQTNNTDKLLVISASTTFQPPTPHSNPLLYAPLLRALVINVSHSPHASLKKRAAYCFPSNATGPQNGTVK